MRATAVGNAFVRSLYPPEGHSHARRLAASVARAWLDRELGIPMRRIMATRGGKL